MEYIIGEGTPMFPYYIVRFKQDDVDIQKIIAESFHTTQYDLNEKMEYIIGEGTPSFHTTQYDLNFKLSENEEQ